MQAAGHDDVDKAVKAARAALHYPSWRQLPASERGQLLWRWADLVEENEEILATIDAWDNGKRP